MNLYLLNYNNYYNRQVKKHDSFDSYIQYIVGIISRVNFNPNDGISTEQVVNYDGRMPNYCILTDAYNNIESRWFVIEAQRLRVGQYKLTLYRDVIVDWYDDIVKAPMFIEKATLNVGNPLIYTEENATTNKIKKSETLLADETGCPWIVGYMASNADSFEVPFDTALNADIEVNKLSDWLFYDYSSLGTIKTMQSIDKIVARAYFKHQINYYAQMGMGDSTENMFTIRPVNQISDDLENWTSAAVNTSLDWPTIDGKVVGGQALSLHTSRVFRDNYMNTAISQLPAYINTTSLPDSILEYNGKIIYEISTGKSYRIAVKLKSFKGDKVRIESGSLFNTIAAALEAGRQEYMSFTGKTIPSYGTPNASSFAVSYDYIGYDITFENVSNATYHVTMSGVEGTNALIDAPYRMFCMPYSDDLKLKIANDLTVQCERDINLQAATVIATLGSSRVYDIQLVPYCPVQGSYSNGVLDISKLNKDIIYATLPSEGGTTDVAVGAVIYCTRSKFSFDIPYTITIPTDSVEFKVAHQCDSYRLCSPNYSGTFEFKATTNDGVSFFNVDCTYKPYSPYIHINPNFGGLYGKDYDDARGLICAGEFSLPMLNDAWATYELQNKNYQRTFDRQIENMEIQQRYQRQSEVTSAAIGTLQGVVSGAAMGGMVGGGAGAVIGGIAGGLASGAAAAQDLYINDKLRAEALDYTKDQFGLQLGNIQALPTSLSRVSAFTNNNKLIPVLEYYSCTETEKEALRNKLKYNGMTVGVIGTIEDYIQPEFSYIKGKLIRLESIADDFHIINTIASELNKGVFI